MTTPSRRGIGAAVSKPLERFQLANEVQQARLARVKVLLLGGGEVQNIEKLRHDITPCRIRTSTSRGPFPTPSPYWGKLVFLLRLFGSTWQAFPNH